MSFILKKKLRQVISYKFVIDRIIIFFCGVASELLKVRQVQLPAMLKDHELLLYKAIMVTNLIKAELMIEKLQSFTLFIFQMAIINFTTIQ